MPIVNRFETLSWLKALREKGRLEGFAEEVPVEFSVRTVPVKHFDMDLEEVTISPLIIMNDDGNWAPAFAYAKVLYSPKRVQAYPAQEVSYGQYFPPLSWAPNKRVVSTYNIRVARRGIGIKWQRKLTAHGPEVFTDNAVTQPVFFRKSEHEIVYYLLFNNFFIFKSEGEVYPVYSIVSLEERYRTWYSPAEGFIPDISEPPKRCFGFHSLMIMGEVHKT